MKEVQGGAWRSLSCLTGMQITSALLSLEQFLLLIPGYAPDYACPAADCLHGPACEASNWPGGAMTSMGSMQVHIPVGWRWKLGGRSQWRCLHLSVRMLPV